MEINRSNYEIWLIDWLDDKLSDIKVEQLQLFLNENPDLREEFVELNLLILKPSEKSFPQKDHLKRSMVDLSGSQFEYLCVAYLENDLSHGQQTELKEIIGKDTEKERVFELVQKMRLTPLISYKNKLKLRKRTPIQNVIRLSAIGLGAAAAVALIFMSYSLIPRLIPDKINSTAKSILVDTTLLKTPVAIVFETPETEQNLVITKQKKENLIAVVKKNSSLPNLSDSTPPVPTGTLLRNTADQESLLYKIPVFAELNLTERSVGNTLIEFKSNYIITEYDDEQSSLSKFIAKTFRERILRENVIKDTPLRGYEIAEAGITGLNKLLGWEMALDEKKDENGELMSVYFSSKFLKFNAPVKKPEPLQ